MMSNELPQLPSKQRKVLLAREVESGTVDKANAIPLSIYKKEKGITSQTTWKPAKHNILGDWEDYEEMERLHGVKEIQPEPEILEESPVEPVVEQPVEKTQESQESQEFVDKLLIFQRYKELREKHALDNWKRHSVEWSQIENRIASKSNRVIPINKKPRDLLMARLGEFRQRIESKQLAEQAMLLLEEQNINFWKEGIRIGNDLLGLSIQLPRGGPRQIERLYYENLNSSGEYLETVGRGLDKVGKELAEAYLERLEKLQEPKEEVETKEQEVVQEEVLQQEIPKGMSLMASADRLYYEVVTGQISTSVMTIYNQGSVAVHFEWVPVTQKNPLHTKLAHDGKQRFFFNYKKGVIKPGTAFDFPIVFQSQTSGIYSESWKLTTMPVTKENEITITLKGVSYEQDLLKEKRKEIDVLLLKRRAQTLAKETMEQVMQRVQSAQNRLDTPPKDYKRKRFEERNRMLKLHFHPVIYDQLIELAAKVFDFIGSKEEWNGSVTVLSNIISQIPQIDMRTEYLTRLNQLVQESTQDVISGHNLMCVISNEILINLAFKVVETSDDLRKRLNLPQKTVNFQENEEQVEEVEVDALKAIDKKNVVVDPKKAVGKTPDPKKPPPPQPKVEPKKKPDSKLTADDESHSLLPKKKKPLSSKGWSVERKTLEQQYSAQLFEIMRKNVYDALGRMTALFGDSS